MKTITLFICFLFLKMLCKTAFDCLSEEAKSPSIITFCKNLDISLGGGVRVKEITDICGAPGTGKTQMCFQLCVSVQLSQAIIGVEGRVLFIDTNQGFSPYRQKEIAQECLERYSQTCSKFQGLPATKVDSSSVLENIKYIYCKDYIELLIILETIKLTLRSSNDIKLLVVDSFSFLFRNFEDNIKRTRIIYEVLTDLLQMANQHEIAVVITNELTTRIINEEAVIYPALGDSLAHKVGQRIILSKKKDDQYVAFLAKCLFAPKNGIPFKIKTSGIRGLG